MTQDYDYTHSGTFAVALANGTYNITLTLGDARGYSYTNSIYFQNDATPTDTVATGGATAVVTRTYKITITNGQLDLGLAGNVYAVIDGLTIAPA